MQLFEVFASPLLDTRPVQITDSESVEDAIKARQDQLIHFYSLRPWAYAEYARYLIEWTPEEMEYGKRPATQEWVSVSVPASR